MEKSYIIIYQGTLTEIENIFKESNIDKYMILNEQLAVIYVPITFDEKKLNAISIITHWERSSPMSSLIEITDNLTEGETVTTAAGTDYIYKNPYITADGKGVIIAIIDSGIDYLHPDFINPDGTTKIISIWDQNHEGQSMDEKYIFGREITRDEINKAIKENDKSLTQDDIGTGTIAAGICCGIGNLNSFYQGVAIGSELIVVKLKEYKDTYMEGKINYQSSDFLAAIKYAIDVANKEDKFLIVNLTIGEKPIATIRATMLQTFEELAKPGVVLVSGSGNEGNTDIHYEGKIMPNERQQDIIFQVGEQRNLEIALFTNGPDKITTELISPAGELSFRIIYSPEYYIYKGTFNIEDTSYQMRYTYPWLESGYQQLSIYLEDIKPGIWTIRLNPEFIINGDFSIYLPNKSLISEDTRFLDPNSSSTITFYASTENIITIGAYNDKTDSLWIGSSKGPVSIRNIKPDIVAPGVDIIGPFKNESYNTATGTGVSSSLVCGVLAIIIQYITQQKSFTRASLYTAVLKTYLMLGATKQDIYNYPNISQGYGILNLSETIIQIANNIE
ncbi:bile acid germinant receptor pseudoprotease CspC [Romboutsia sp.]|uniref:bile acid germinant receptor pseudoprotease CspC n=1 Tax=Romboutsia sp. TaxID=1965302 RepID=UPI002B8CB41A|nr:bile acid germinant receptor pseudoprotease CspC [Romboutsia sp.]HSQ90216.1 bile acid germinant receptor pseudoprotease CspC [Romboutsia sp.]